MGQSYIIVVHWIHPETGQQKINTHLVDEKDTIGEVYDFVIQGFHKVDVGPIEIHETNETGKK